MEVGGAVCAVNGREGSTKSVSLLLSLNAKITFSVCPCFVYIHNSNNARYF